MKAFIGSLQQGWQEFAAPWRQRWLALEPREQRVVGIGGAAALLLLLVYGLWLPSHRAAENAEKQFQRNRGLLMELQAQAPAGNGGAAGGGSLLGMASATAGSAGLTLGRIEPEGDNRVRVWLDKADFNRVAAWLATLSQQGVRLEEAQVERLAEGGISARFALTR
jgi:general secretion pathway protein M